MLGALDMDKYREHPLIAKIIELLPDNMIKVHWYCASWTNKWTPAKQKQGLQWVDWTEVPKESVIVTVGHGHPSGLQQSIGTVGDGQPSELQQRL